MTTSSLYDFLKSIGIVFTKEQAHAHDVPVWKAYLDSEVVGVSKWLGELVRDVSDSLGN
jgi:hypothetical protein